MDFQSPAPIHQLQPFHFLAASKTANRALPAIARPPNPLFRRLTKPAPDIHADPAKPRGLWLLGPQRDNSIRSNHRSTPIHQNPMSFQFEAAAHQNSGKNSQKKDHLQRGCARAFPPGAAHKYSPQPARQLLPRAQSSRSSLCAIEAPCHPQQEAAPPQSQRAKVKSQNAFFNLLNSQPRRYAQALRTLQDIF